MGRRVSSERKHADRRAGLDTPPDVIIVGGGTAGSVLAARLSEDSGRSVLLLEAGPSFNTVARLPPEIRQVGSLAAAVPGHPNNWSFSGRLTQELTYPVPRGKIAGGSSSLNGAYFVRGVPDDFQRWVDTGNDQWSFEHVLPYYRKMEDDRDFGGQFHGAGGPIPVERQGGDLMSPLTAAFIEAGLRLGFAEEDDKNCPGTPGIGLLPLNAVDGVRISTAVAYLMPSLARSNLEVRPHTFVRRVLFHGDRAIGVEAEDRAGRQERIHAGEVILCAGAIGSPHLLLLSGIGPADELRALGVPVVRDSPGVGKDFADHPELWVLFRPKRMMMPTHPDMAFLQAALNYTADGSNIVGDMEIVCGVRSIGEITVGSGISSLRGIADILRRPLRTRDALRGVALRRLLADAQAHADVPLICGLQQELSRGDIRITSASPHVPPLLDYNYLAEAADLERMRQCVRLAAELLDAAPLGRLIATRTSPSDADLATNQAVDKWMHSNLATAIHMSATCKMGPASNERAVVDQSFRVHGVSGLRVVDTSAMPELIRRGPSATAVMMGERAADLIVNGSRPAESDQRSIPERESAPAGDGAGPGTLPTPAFGS
jgi:choline dehydrogenase